ncbi:MAG: DUF2127 domain-containing protein [Anaerolineales bacterium]|nr:DUF2127 domain-containing protein [Anaerolineales bacterium]
MDNSIKTRGSLILNLYILLFSIEKVLQHLLTAIFFAVEIPSIGTPDIGPNFQLSNQVMAVLNIFYACLFVIGLIGYMKRKNWGSYFLIVLAALDILLEFLFHGFFFITISVIISTLLIINVLWYRKANKG